MTDYPGATKVFASGGHIVHLILEPERHLPIRGSRKPAICGRAPQWFDPAGWRWNAPADRIIIADWQVCKNCVTKHAKGRGE